MKYRFLGLVLALVAGSAMAQNPAALVSVRASSGDVQVDGVALPVDQSVGAAAGAEVSVVNGEALVTYPNGCTVTVTARYTVAATAPAECPADAAPRDDTKAASAGLIAIGAFVALSALGDGGDDDGPSSP